MSKQWLAAYGGPGTGKTTLLQRLSDTYRQDLNYEYVHNNSILEENSRLWRYHRKLFEEGDYSYFFRFQMEILPIRFRQSQESSENALVDESIFSTFAYTHALRTLDWLSADDYDTFLANYRIYSDHLEKPSCILFLDCPNIITILDRIARRQRAIEQNFSRAYLESLQHSFAEVADEIQKENRLIRIDVENLTEDQLFETAVRELTSIGFLPALPPH